MILCVFRSTVTTLARRIGGILAACCNLMIVAGCSQHRFYEGPELPPEQESVLQMDNYMELLRFDNKKAPYLFAGQIIRALPGKHSVAVTMRIPKGKTNCSRSNRIPSGSQSDYDTCRRNGNRDETIVGNILFGTADENCWDQYVRTFEICDHHTLYGSCSTDWDGRAGKHDYLRFVNDGSIQFVESNGLVRAERRCSMEGKTRIEALETQLN